MTEGDQIIKQTIVFSKNVTDSSITHVKRVFDITLNFAELCIVV